MICIPYLTFTLLGFIILLNKSKNINKILTYLGVLIVIPLGFLPVNNIIQINFLGYNLEIIKPDSTSHYLIISFILTFIVGILHNMNLKPINYKEIGFISLLTSCGIFIVTTNNLIISIIIIQIIVILYSIIIAIDKLNSNKLSFLKVLFINFFGILLFFIGIDFYTSITGKTTIENLVLFQHFSKYLVLTGLLILLGLPLLINNLVETINSVNAKNSLFLAIFLPVIILVLLIKLFSGEPILFYIGLFFTLYGVLFSVLTSNLRKILTYSIIHTTGFIMMCISYTSDINWYVINNFFFTYILSIISLFVIVSYCEHFFHTNNILELKGIFYSKPLIGIALLFIAFNSLSMPFTTNFILKNLALTTLKHYNNNYLIYILIFFSMAAYALHIGFRILYFLYLSKPISSKINEYKNYRVNKTTLYILLSILLITIIQTLLLYLKSDINYLNNTLNGFKTGFIGIFLFIITYQIYNYKKEFIIYQFSNIIINYSCILLLNIVTILRQAYTISIDKSRIFITKILVNGLKITNLYYNSRIIIVVLIFVLILGLTLIIL